MPEPNRVPWLIEEQLGGWAVWQLCEMNVVLTIKCDACQHSARWTPADTKRRLRRHTGRPLWMIARKLRCSACRSEWLRISAESGSLLGGRAPMRHG